MCCTVTAVFAVGCVPGFRPGSEKVVLRRYVVQREKRILNRRIRRLRRRMRQNPDFEDGDMRDRALFRLRRMRRVRLMLIRKLDRYEVRIPFRRRQWRLAYNAGCRRYR